MRVPILVRQWIETLDLEEPTFGPGIRREEAQDPPFLERMDGLIPWEISVPTIPRETGEGSLTPSVMFWSGDPRWRTYC